MLSQYAVDHPTFPVNQRYFHLIVILGDCSSAAQISRHIFGIRMVYRETFLASSSSLYPGGFNPWISNVTEDTSPHVTSERQNPDTALDPRCQSGTSARNSFDPQEGRFSKDYGADQQRLQISDLHFDKFPNPATIACWKIRFKTEVCSCSQLPTDVILWIKEVEMVDSVDDLKIFAFYQRNSRTRL